MGFTSKQIAEVILGMRDVYAKGGNAMEWCRERLRSSGGADVNHLYATLVAYDLQSGSYIDAARCNAERNLRWCQQLARLLDGVLSEGDSVLEVGVGEATTLAGVLREVRVKPRAAFGFDVSWSRVCVGRKWLSENHQNACLFVGDLLNMPLADNSVDVVYSSHSLEPNRGSEEKALRECLRVARKAIVLVEPLYELASSHAQERMRQHKYVEGLCETARRLGANVVDHRLLEFTSNPLNPSGVLLISKDGIPSDQVSNSCSGLWRCPLTGLPVESKGDHFFAPDAGLAYPVLREIPLLRAEHAVVASKLGCSPP
jgi:SAM-dependent methyltransferase